MTELSQDQIEAVTKTIAEYDGKEWFEINNPHVCKYHTSLDWLNPVWCKAMKEADVSGLWIGQLVLDYHKAIDTNDTSGAFLAVVQAIELIQGKP